MMKLKIYKKPKKQLQIKKIRTKVTGLPKILNGLCES